MLKNLWKDIQYIYDGFNYSSRLLVDDLIIISQDNHYLLYYKPTNREEQIQIRIEKQHNLVRMWSDDNEVDAIGYKIYVEVGTANLPKVEVDENYKIELTYNIIKPFLREAKLNKIGV
jgi:hypothetical protein